MPGIYRLVTLTVLNHCFGLTVVGEVSANWALIQIAAIFTFVGWSSLLLSRLPGKQVEIQNGEFFNILISGLMTCLPAFAILCFFWEGSITSLVLFLLSSTVYSLIRQKLIVIEKYWKLVGYDCLELLLTVALIFLIRYELSGGLSYNYVIIIPACILSFFYLMEIYSKTNFQIKWRFERSGMIFGFSNFVSGGIAYLLVPLASSAKFPVIVESTNVP